MIKFQPLEIGDPIIYHDSDGREYPGVITEIITDNMDERRATVNIFVPYASMGNIVKSRVTFSESARANSFRMKKYDTKKVILVRQDW